VKQDTLPMLWCVDDKDDTAISLVYLEQENNFISRPKKLIGDDEHGWTENRFLI
jgi:hypothetical protein